MKKVLIYSILSFILIANADYALAQCAMCKATLEANSANSNKYGVGLNTGILYLMTIPYISASILGYLWYCNAKLKTAGSKY